LLWSRPQPQEPKLSHVEHSGDTFLTRKHIRTWGRRCWVCSYDRSAGPLTLRLLPAAVFARRTTASSAATLIRGHPRPWPLSTLATPPPGATIPVPACGYFPLRLLPRRRRMNRQRGDHTRRTPAASTGAVDTGCLLLGHRTPIAAPLQPPTLVPRPPPPSWAPPPPSPLATTANVSVAVRLACRPRKAARCAGGTHQFSAQAPHPAAVSMPTTTATTAELPPPSPSSPPPPPGCPRRHPAHHHRFGRWCQPPPPRGCPRRHPAHHHRGTAPAVALPTTTAGLHPQSPCLPPPPRGCPCRRSPTTIAGLQLPSPCPPQPRGCPRRLPAAHVNGRLP